MSTAYKMISNESLMLMAVIGLLFVLNPEDFVYFCEFLLVKAKMVALNYYLMYQAWIAYRLLAKSCTKMGLPLPAFHFVPIWKR